MATLFRNEKNAERGGIVGPQEADINLKTATAFIFVQILFLIVNGLQIDFQLKLAAFAVIIATTAGMAYFALTRNQASGWLHETWELSKSLLPVLFIGVFIAGVVQALLPTELVSPLLGGNSLTSNLFAAVSGAFMYFATLTEVPIIQALMAKGMGAGPALSLLLAGPALSLPSMLVIDKILGHKKTVAYISLVIIFSTLAGMIYGMVAA